MSWRSSYSKILMNAKKLHVFEFNRFKLLQKVNLFKAIYWTSLYFDGNNGQYSLVHGGTFKISFRPCNYRRSGLLSNCQSVVETHPACIKQHNILTGNEDRLPFERHYFHYGIFYYRLTILT